MKQENRIMTVSMTGGRRQKCFSVVSGEILSFAGMTEIRKTENWKKELIEDIRDKLAKGFIVAVEEMIPEVSSKSGAAHVSLSDIDAFNERINLWLALDYYFDMRDKGSLVGLKKVKSFEIRDSLIQRLSDEKGRVKYEINWDVINAGHRAVLLSVLVSMRNPVSDKFLADFSGGGMTGSGDDENFAERMNNSILRQKKGSI